MLVITVKIGKEKILVGGARVCVLDYRSNEITLGFEADRSIKIDRITEEYQCKRTKRQNVKDQKQNSKKWLASECTPAVLKRLKSSSGQSKNGSTEKQPSSLCCDTCYEPTLNCNCRF